MNNGLTCYKKLNLNDMTTREKWYWECHVKRWELRYGGKYPFPTGL